MLVLRDAFGLTGPEVAEILDTSPGNVRVILHRARKALEAYDERRRPVTDALRDKSARLMRELMARMAIGDFEGVAKLLAEDVTSVHDAGGEFIASVRVQRGVEDVVSFYRNVLPYSTPPVWAKEQDLNGLPALAFSYGPDRDPKYVKHVLFWVELDADDRIVGIRSVLASAKLRAIRFGA